MCGDSDSELGDGGSFCDVSECAPLARVFDFTYCV